MASALVLRNDGRVRGERERVELAALDGDAGSAADDVGNTGRGGADAVFDGVRSVYLTGFRVVFGEVVAHVMCDVHAGLL